MNVCFCIDQNYAIHTLVAIHGLVKFTKKSNISIYLIVENKKLVIYELIDEYLKQQGVSVIILEHIINYNFQVKISHHISLAAYTRLFLASILPLNVKKVLYLDSDVIVFKSVDELYEFDLENSEIGAVEEFLGAEHNKRIGLNANSLYYNSGVLLINLQKWRENKLEERFVDYLVRGYDKILWWDQDVINAVSQSIVKLNDKWNVTSQKLKLNSEFLNKGEVGILHYTGDKKPWNGSYGALDIEYFVCLSDLCKQNHIARKVFWKYLNRNLYGNNMTHLSKSIKNVLIYFSVIYNWWYNKNLKNFIVNNF